MVDGAPPKDPSQEPVQHEDLPDRLRVHQLARALGSTNKEVLDALVAIDGRARNVQSGVDREDALRVRDLIFAKPLPNIPGFSSAPVAQQPLLLRSSTEPAEYMPLFVAPQPVHIDDGGDAEDADSDDSYDEDDQADRPANRRRRRGRRGRGRRGRPGRPARQPAPPARPPGPGP
ncbi:ribonuclease E/G, partial [Mycobacterium palustre]|nr:ribonuclease E/G [Mycobacterium palustre]